MLETKLKGKVSRPLPQPEQDTDLQEIRTSRYGDVYVKPLWSTMHTVADEGGYFVATSPTPGTGIATTTSITAETAVSPVMVVKNNDQQTLAAKRIYLHYLKMLLTAAPTSATAWQAVMRLDNVNRYTSGGSAIVSVNVNMDFGASDPITQVYFGAIVAPAIGPSIRLVYREQIRNAIPIVGDEWTFVFGSAEMARSAQPAATLDRQVFAAPPVVLGPQQTWLLNMFGAANAGAPAWEFELGYFIR